MAARISKDGAAFAAATNAVTEIGTDAVYALDLTAAEMNADQITVRITSGGKPVFALIHATVRQVKDLAFPNVSGRGVDVDAVGGVEVGTNLDKTGYAMAPGGIGSGAHAAAELNNIADAGLDRIMSVGTDSGGDNTTTRTVRQALRVNRNKATVAAGVLTVKKEDDITTSFTAAVTTTAGNPISEVDPT